MKRVRINLCSSAHLTLTNEEVPRTLNLGKKSHEAVDYDMVFAYGSMVLKLK